MYRISFITLIFSFLVLLTVGCDPGTSCPKGQVLATDSNSCVENTCIDYACDINQHCVVSAKFGPDCECNRGTVGHHDNSGAHPILVCEVPVDDCSCTGENAFCDSKGDCVCDDDADAVWDDSGMHPVLNCVNPCDGYDCGPHRMCQSELDESTGLHIPVCDIE